MKIKNTNKGITLIALVITIIVMLILVAVTISMAVNGGLFEYASNAGTQTNAAVDAEQEFANLETNMTVGELIEKYSGITASTVYGNPERFYGATVTNYTLPEANTEEIEWKIFHSDGENIYLITSDLVDTVPDFTFSEYSNDTDGYIIPKSNVAYKWIGDDYSKSTFGNMKEVAFMLDTSKWNRLYKTDYANYAIGAATLKMFADSYNATHEMEISFTNIGGTDLPTGPLGDTGYVFNVNGSDFSAQVDGLDAELRVADAMYFFDSDKCSKYTVWPLAAPACDYLYKLDVWGVCGVMQDGSIHSSGDREPFLNYYYRPVVCLNSNVALVENVENGTITYKIVEQ